MGYTQSMDVSKRVKKNGMGNYFRHLYRNLYPDAKHSNTNINPNLTKNNIEFVYDDDLGRLVVPESPEDLEKVTSDIKEYSKTHTVRKDAVYVRPLMFQLGSDFYKDYPDGFKNEDGLSELDLMYQWACSVWGKERIRGVVVHRDEVHTHEGHEGEITPHMSILVSPIKHDGDSITMSQKNIINGNKHLKTLHAQLRKYMAENGIDIQIENLETSAPHRKDEEYKQFKDKQRALEKEIAQLKEERGQDKAELKAYEDALRDQFEQEKAELRAELKAEKDELSLRRKKIDAREKSANKQEKQAVQLNEDLNNLMTEASGLMQSIQLEKKREDMEEQARKIREEQEKHTKSHKDLFAKYKDTIAKSEDISGGGIESQVEGIEF